MGPFAASSSAAISDAEITALMTRLATDESAERRATREAIIAAGVVMVPHLLARAEHPDWNVRWKVVNCLGYLEDRRATLPLVERVVGDVNPHVRWRALWAITALDDTERVTAEFERRLAQPATRWTAAVGLSMFEHPAAIPVLLEEVENPDSFIRFEAINGLGRSYDANTSGFLAALRDHPDTRTRQEVVMSLGRIRDEAAVIALMDALHDASPGVRWRAAMGLKLAGDERAIEALSRLLAEESDEEVRKHVAEALGQLDRSRLRDS